MAFVILRFSDAEPLKTFWNAPRLQKIIALALTVLPFLMIYVPPFNRAFGFSAIDPLALLISIATGILIPAIYFFVKRFFKTNADFQ